MVTKAENGVRDGRVCQEDLSSFTELTRYIYLNPLRAGRVPDARGLSRYPYCGHSALLGKTERPW